jgi:hypothetical protein
MLQALPSNSDKQFRQAILTSNFDKAGKQASRQAGRPEQAGRQACRFTERACECDCACARACARACLERAAKRPNIVWKLLFAAPWTLENHGFYCTRRRWAIEKHGFYCTDRIWMLKAAPAGPRDDPGHSQDAPGSAQSTLGAPRNLSPGRPEAPRSVRKMLPGGLAASFSSVPCGHA